MKTAFIATLCAVAATAATARLRVDRDKVAGDRPADANGGENLKR